jgi:hypothetical protein
MQLGRGSYRWSNGGGRAQVVAEETVDGGGVGARMGRPRQQKAGGSGYGLVPGRLVAGRTEAKSGDGKGKVGVESA